MSFMQRPHSRTGYLLSGRELDEDDFTAEDTSIVHLSSVTNSTFDELLRGLESFGHYLELAGYESVPSPTNPGPNGDAYFSGKNWPKIVII